MPQQTIDRISASNGDRFHQDYVAKRRPVVLTDLFRGQPIDAIRTREEAIDAFGNVLLKVGPEYSTYVFKELLPEPSPMSFRDYWFHVDRDPTTSLMCTEYETPARVSALFRLPELCLTRSTLREEVLGLPSKWGDHDLFSNSFIGNAGNVAAMHYDGDHREVLLHQIFGCKEFILFHPKDGVPLRPFELGIPFSGHEIQKMSETERDAIIDQANGFHGVLRPGETLYIPALMWHFLRYIDHGMSFNLRFGRNRIGRFLCTDNFHRDCFIQIIGADLAQVSDEDQSHDDEVTTIMTEYLRPASSLSEKVRSIRTLFRQLLKQHHPEIVPDDFCPMRREAEEIGEILSDIGSGPRYLRPEDLVATRLAGPATAAQIEQLEKGFVRCGYPNEIASHLLWNRLGKSSVSELNRAEAALFLNYMQAPGASY